MIKKALIGISARRRVTAADVTPPSAPVLSSTGSTSTSITVSWIAATDNVGVTGYDVYKNNSFVTTVVVTNYTLTGLTASTQYTILIKAKDAAGNTTDSNTLTITTPAVSAYVIEGYGSQVTGGDNLSVVHVTNLNTSGTGSLQAAMGSNRRIVFDVGGTINGFAWDADNFSNVQNLTIDGLTAPSPGITLVNNNNGNGLSFNQNCSNLIIRGIRMRGNAGNDAMNLVGAHDVLFDRCSISGAHDGNLDISEGAFNVTVQYCIIGGGSSDWSGAMLLGYVPTKNLSVHHNLFCAITAGGVGERIPFIRANENSAAYADMIVEFKNNLIWRWGRSNGTGSGYATGFDFAGTGMIIKNYYYSTSSPGTAVEFDVDPTAGSGYKAYVSGNFSGNGSAFPTGNVPAWTIPPPYQVIEDTPCAAAQKVLATAGVRPLDAVDQAFINAINLPGC